LLFINLLPSKTKAEFKEIVPRMYVLSFEPKKKSFRTKGAGEAGEVREVGEKINEP
jgi:hypothetical protein